MNNFRTECVCRVEIPIQRILMHFSWIVRFGNILRQNKFLFRIFLKESVDFLIRLYWILKSLKYHKAVKALPPKKLLL